MRAMGMGTHHWVRDGEREEGNLSETPTSAALLEEEGDNGVKGRDR